MDLHHFQNKRSNSRSTYTHESMKPEREDEKEIGSEAVQRLRLFPSLVRYNAIRCKDATRPRQRNATRGRFELFMQLVSICIVCLVVSQSRPAKHEKSNFLPAQRRWSFVVPSSWVTNSRTFSLFDNEIIWQWLNLSLLRSREIFL